MSLPQRRKALYRVEHSGDAPRWFHYSQKNDAVVLRSLRQAKPNNDIEWEQQRYRLPEDLARLNSELSGAKEFPLPSGLSIEHPNKWLEVFESLDSAVDTIPVTKGRNEPEVDPAIGATQTDRIPQTRWRRLYQTLRDFGTLGLQKQMVEDLVNTRSSKKLQYIFSDSVSHFSRRYKDTRAFRGGQSASLQGYRDATEQFARCVAARLECGAVQVIRVHYFQPFRTGSWNLSITRLARSARPAGRSSRTGRQDEAAVQVVSIGSWSMTLERCIARSKHRGTAPRSSRLFRRLPTRQS